MRRAWALEWLLVQAPLRIWLPGFWACAPEWHAMGARFGARAAPRGFEGPKSESLVRGAGSDRVFPSHLAGGTTEGTQQL